MCNLHRLHVSHKTFALYRSKLLSGFDLPQVRDTSIRALLYENMLPEMLDKRIREKLATGINAVIPEYPREESSVIFMVVWIYLRGRVRKDDREHLKYVLQVKQRVWQRQSSSHEVVDLRYVDIVCPVLVKRWFPLLIKLRAEVGSESPE